jgi:hypothetical protein
VERSTIAKVAICPCEGVDSDVGSEGECPWMSLLVRQRERAAQGGNELAPRIILKSSKVRDHPPGWPPTTCLSAVWVDSFHACAFIRCELGSFLG